MLALMFYGDNLLSQNVQPKPTRQLSIEAFTRGDYESAYRGFSDLLVIYPKDPLYKYYTGVCLVSLSLEPEKAVTLLSQAQQGAAVVRTIPSDALFWLGRAQQMSGKFAEAEASYKAFIEQSGKKAARDLGVDNFIQQCNSGKGQITGVKQIPDIKEEAVIQVEEKKLNVNEPVKDNLSPDLKNLPADYDSLLSEALNFQSKADSLYRIAGERSRNLEELSYKERTDIKAQITEIETLAATFQKKADQKYAEAQNKMNVQLFVKEENIIKDSTIEDKKPVVIEKPVEIKEDKTVKDSLAAPVVKSEYTSPVKKSVEVFSVFEVIKNPVFKTGEKIPINPAVPPGLIYRIQVAVFRNPVAPSYFKGITPVYGFKVKGTDRTNYYAGMFRRIADANKALIRVRQKGFKDAFIVPLSGGKAVSSERAAFLEKEWGTKPFMTAVRAKEEIPADTIPPTLSFRVEVMRSAKPLKPDVVEGMKKLAGTRGLDTETLSGETVIYLIGKFITYDSAAEYADLLARNGFREAKVVAWLGKKEIPVDTARQLFEDLK
jgi:tetratricopeptide (TPR) repeat protein/sulfur carrier protein ThiS